MTPPAPNPAAALSFDMDGVLVDVSRSFPVAIERTVAACGGGAVGPEDVRRLKETGGFNNDWDVSVELLRQRGRVVARAEVIAVFNRFYLEGPDALIHQEQWLLPAPLLAALGTRYRLAIFTGRPRADAEYSLRLFGVAEAFATMVAMEDAPEKPSPEGLRRLQSAFAPLPLAAHLGDTIDDHRSAEAAGIPFVGICPPGSTLEHRFRAAGVRATFPDVAAAARSLLASLGG